LYSRLWQDDDQASNQMKRAQLNIPAIAANSDFQITLEEAYSEPLSETLFKVRCFETIIVL